MGHSRLKNSLIFVKRVLNLGGLYSAHDPCAAGGLRCLE